MLAATAVSSISTCSSAAPSIASSALVTCASLSPSESSTSTVHGAAASGCRSCGQVPSHELERERVHHLEARETGAEPLLGQSEQRRRRGKRRQRRHRGHHGGRPRMQLQRRRRDDRQRPFAADEEIAQVVAGVVLAQARKAVPDAAFGSDGLEAEAQLARVAVAQHLRAAGVGREVAADLQLPWAARLSGNIRPCAAAPFCTACRTQPASATARGCCVDAADPVERASESSTCSPLSSGTEPPTRPVLPP